MSILICCRVFKIILVTVSIDSIVLDRTVLIGLTDGFPGDEDMWFTTVWNETVRRELLGNILDDFLNPILDAVTPSVFSMEVLPWFSNGPSGRIAKPEGSRRKSDGSSPRNTLVIVVKSTGMYTRSEQDSSIQLSWRMRILLWLGPYTYKGLVETPQSICKALNPKTTK